MVFHHDLRDSDSIMTLITFQNGKPVLTGGKVGTEQACCCEAECSGPCEENEDCPPGCECNRVGCAYYFSPLGGECPPGSEFFRGCPPGEENSVECIGFAEADDCGFENSPFSQFVNNCNQGLSYGEGVGQACGPADPDPDPAPDPDPEGCAGPCDTVFDCDAGCDCVDGTCVEEEPPP